MHKVRAPRNRTTHIPETERDLWAARLVSESAVLSRDSLFNRTIHGDSTQCISLIPSESIDLLILDPPYNLDKDFGQTRFTKRTLADYAKWLRTWFEPLLRVLKRSASVYICADWSSSPAIFEVASEHLIVRNRITWEREKGRGARMNWKNCSEDIWFCTVSDDYTFNSEAVKLKRRVIAPYRHNGQPKGWCEHDEGPYRLTSPSNLWTDITVPFWSMPENTDHPTQKPEKLIAKLILASSNPEDLVLDPFLGSGTTSVVCKKLNRRFIGIEAEEEYCLLAEKRIDMATELTGIQGFDGAVFLERNTLHLQMQRKTHRERSPSLFNEA